MKACLYAEGLSEQTAFTCRIAFTILQASELTEHDAQESGAAREFPEYKWTMVNLPGSAFFLVEGEEKKSEQFCSDPLQPLLQGCRATGEGWLIINMRSEGHGAQI
jgi:hypothetical protein